MASADLNATLLSWPPGHEVPEHVNADLDVLVVVVYVLRRGARPGGDRRRIAPLSRGKRGDERHDRADDAAEDSHKRRVPRRARASTAGPAAPSLGERSEDAAPASPTCGRGYRLTFPLLDRLVVVGFEADVERPVRPRFSALQMVATESSRR